MKKNLFLLLFIVSFIFNISGVSFALQPKESVMKSEEEIIGEEPIDTSIKEAPAEKLSAPGNVTLVFKDADITTVLHTLSYKSGVNIVAASDVEGKVSIRLVDVPWQTALDVILKNNGLAHEKMGNIIRVITLASVAEEDLQNEVFILNYAKAPEVAAAIGATLTERGSVKFDARTNTLIVTDIPTNLYKVATVIERLDKRTPQVSIEAKIIEARLDDSLDYGINWNMEVTATGSSRPTTFPFERDASPFTRETGKDTNVDGYFPLGDDADDFPSITSPVFPYVAAGSFEFGTLDFSAFTATLKLLQDNTDTKVISNPTIATLNNQPAKIVVGEIFNIPTYERNSETGVMEITGYEEKDIGIILTVTPHINDAGDIVVDLKPEVSAFIGFDNFGTANDAIQAPRFSTRTAETQVMVRHNQTIAIGGLRENTTVEREVKVPFLGSIPILGELFKYTEDDVDTKDLLIFVTVRLIDENQDDSELIVETERKFFGKKEIEYN